MQFNLTDKRVSYKDQVLQYINIIGEPFDAKMVAAETNVSLATVRVYLSGFLKKGVIRKLKTKKRVAYYAKRPNPKPKRRYTTRKPDCIYKEDVLQFLEELEEDFKLSDIQAGLKCTYHQARRHILQLQKENIVKSVSQDGHVWVYSTNLKKSKCKLFKVKRAAEKLQAKGIPITKATLLVNTDLSYSSIRLALEELIESQEMKIDHIENTENFYTLISPKGVNNG